MDERPSVGDSTRFASIGPLRGLGSKSMSANQRTTDGTDRSIEGIAAALRDRGYRARIEDGSIIVADADLPLPTWALNRAANEGLIQDRAAGIEDGVALRPRGESR